MPSTYVFARNGMGDYATGTGMREDMLMQVFNMFLFQAGVFASTDFAVTETGTPSMAVTVAAGRCFVLNSSYAVNTANSTKFWGVLAEEFELAIGANVSGSTRYDIVVVKINTGAAANDYATNVATVEIVVGTPGSGVPATPSNCLKIAEVEVASGATSITDSEITDSRVFIQMKSSESDVDWTDFTPLSYGGTGSMTFTGVTVNTCKYMRVGRKVTVVYDLTGTSGGTGSFNLWFELPVDIRPNADGVYSVGAGKFADQTVTSTGKGGRVSIDATKIYTSKYDTSNWGLAAGQNIAGVITYEVD